MNPRAELEFKLIGSVLMLGGDARYRIFSRVTPDFFTLDDTREIFERLRGVCSEHPEADMSVLVSALNKNLQVAVVSALSGMLSSSIAEAGLDDTLDAADELMIKQRIRSRIDELAVSKEITPEDVRRFAEDVEGMAVSRETDSRERYLENYELPIKLIPTGFEKLDEKLGGGIRAGTLFTVGARPGTGKTAFAINLAAHNPDRDVLFFSIEMTADMIFDRLVSDIADVEYSDASKHGVQKETVRAVLEKYSHLLVIDSVSSVESIVTMICEKKPEMVMIDYIQIISSKRRFIDNRQRIDHISAQLKQAAKKTGCCIILLSQLTRAGKDRPTMSDLKESGALEQDGDYVVLLYRPFVNDKLSEDADPEKTTLTLDKNKFGNTACFAYRFNGKRQRFTELEEKGAIAKPQKRGVSSIDDLPF